MIRKNKIVLAVIAMITVLAGVFFLQKLFSPKNASNQDETMSDSQKLESDVTADFQENLKGSCDLISQASTCIDYYGANWTQENINLVCSEGTSSTEACPKPNLGGCQIKTSTETDMVTWYYESGGQPFTENINDISQACNSIEGGLWVK